MLGEDAQPESDFPIDLGGGVRLKRVKKGFLIRHVCRQFNSSERLINAPLIDTVTGKLHHVVKDEPLTIERSILCPQCGLHGYITNGKWTPA